MSAEAQVQVLLATYNGARFLAEQMDSILGQSYEDTVILARDDGSSDGTAVILAEYAAREPERVFVLEAASAGSGAKGNFLTLLQHCSASYVAFADQDDVWLPDKLAREMEAMRGLEAGCGEGAPLLVFSDLQVVDQGLETVHASFWQHERHEPGRVRELNHLLMQNVVVGCTALLNRPLVELARAMPAEAHMHDWWVALLACLFGGAAWVREATVLYRQHDANVFGASAGPAGGLPDRRNDGPRRAQWLACERQAEALLRMYGSRMSGEQRRLLEAMVRCEASPSRVERVFTLVRHRLFLATARQNAAMVLHLWDKG